jgi:hypothetical protein
MTKNSSLNKVLKLVDQLSSNEKSKLSSSLDDSKNKAKERQKWS